MARGRSHGLVPQPRRAVHADPAADPVRHPAHDGHGNGRDGADPALRPAACCGAAAILLAPGMLIVHNDWQPALFAAGFLAMMIVPGHILNYRSNHPKSDRHGGKRQESPRKGGIGTHRPHLRPQVMFKELNPLLHSELRLAVMSILIGVESADFVFIRRQTGATAGNLSVQLDKLAKAGYIAIEKTFRGRMPAPSAASPMPAATPSPNTSRRSGATSADSPVRGYRRKSPETER